ncbi:hypothetical protein CspeluHIS016_0102250 [Cutaneotrichosporon spelunceum]|uniref:Uncharacterized protein n=1 Tax=Cutaneotrichosporon spelunceum TaxID=1672016 RepID=A0AAD3TNA4_9TREE|nr:hypothetical protein CspeluHIS016_0102250 [Cutaneotrichosporon spelunceum]
MSSPASLSALADPMALARLQVLLVPVHRDGTEPLLEPVFEHWSQLFRNHHTLRGDEIVHSGTQGSPAHRRGAPESPRSRFLPSAPGTSISRAAGASTVQLAFPSQPPAKHLYALNLLRMSAFPLVVIGIAVDDVEGYSVGKETPTQDKAAAAQVWIQTFTQVLSGIMPPSSAFPLVKRLVLVPSQLPVADPRGTPGSSSVGTPRASVAGSRSPTSSFIRHAPSEGGDSWVTKLLGEAIGEVYGELGELVASLESQIGMKTLSSTLLPSLCALPEQGNTTPRSSVPSQASGSASPRHSRQSSGMVRTNSMPAVPTITRHPTRTLTPGGRPTSVQGPSAPPIQSSTISPAAPSPSTLVSSNPFKRSSMLSSPFNRASSAGTPVASKESKDSMGVTRFTSAPLTGIGGGRLLKLLGDMYLLTGRYNDAVKCYDEAAEKSRAVGDVLWEALAREGRAVAGIGEAWEARDGSTHSTPFPSSPVPVEILSHYLSALACLSRAPLPFPPNSTILSPSPKRASLSLLPTITPSPTQVGTGEGLLAYLYSTLCIRISHFVLTIFAAGGWGSIAVSSLISQTLPHSFPPLIEDGNAGGIRTRNLALSQLASESQLTRHSILGHAEAGVASFRKAMTKPEQLAVYVEVVRIARWLDIKRKEALATREVLKLIGAIIVEGREEYHRLFSQAAARAQGTDSSGTEGATVYGLGTQVPNAVARRKETTDGNFGIVELVERICAVLGVDLLSLGDPNKGYEASKPMQDQGEPHFGWPDLQVEVIKEAITIAESLPDPLSVVRLCLSALHSLHPYLSQANQAQLCKLYVQAISILRRRAMEIGTLPWWIPGRMVLCVEIASLTPNKAPFEHARVEIVQAQKAQGAKDPFLYNPRLKAVEQGKTVLVANEQVDVFVTLANPLAVDLEIQDLSLLTSGSPFVTNPLPLVLPASSVQTVRVTGNAPATGSLQIRGVNIRLSDGSSAEFLVPIMDVSGPKGSSKRRSAALADLAKVKRQGLEARDSVVLGTDALPVTEDDGQWIECNVVEEQPLLWIKKTSLNHGTVMLYDGEMSVIRITVENSSPVPVDFVKLSFEDSVTREAQYLLADGEQTPQKAYELDYDISKQPIFTWDNKAPLSIPPGGRTTLSVQVLGKVGCTDGTIYIDYGFVNRAESTSSFYTRRLTYPVLFTVYRTLECFALDLVSMRSDSQAEARQRLANGTTPRSTTFATSSDEELKRALARGDDRSVLFCINVRNVFSVPFEVALATTEGESGSVVTRLVPPGATERLVLPIQRQSLSAELRAQPIPSAGRQYVVDKQKKTAAEIALEREAFWYRERLFEMVNVSWREPGSLRAGHLSLRGQPLTAAHVDSLRLNEVVVSLSVTPRDADGPKAMDFVDLRITVTNHLERKLSPYVRLEALPTSSTDTSWSVPAPPPAPRRFSSLPATPMPLPKTVAFDGVLAATLPSLGPGDSASHVVGAILLASGSYTFRAAAEEVSQAVATAPPSVCFSPSVTVRVP